MDQQAVQETVQNAADAVLKSLGLNTKVWADKAPIQVSPGTIHPFDLKVADGVYFPIDTGNIDIFAEDPNFRKAILTIIGRNMLEATGWKLTDDEEKVIAHFPPKGAGSPEVIAYSRDTSVAVAEFSRKTGRVYARTSMIEEEYPFWLHEHVTLRG